MKDTWYTIARLHRDDLTALFTDTDIALFDDGAMEALARKMGQAYIDNSFWIDLEILAEDVIRDKRQAGQDD